MPSKPTPKRQGGLSVIIRPDTGALTITGYISGQRIRQRAQSSDLRLAREEAAALEADLLRTEWHGERRGTRLLAEAITSYVESARRAANTKALLSRILRATGNVALREIDQQAALRLRKVMLTPGAADATYMRNILTPLRAVMSHANAQGWCDMPRFISPKMGKGRTKFLLPDEAEQLIAAAAAHLQPLLIFLITTGARMAEAIELDWRAVDLTGRRVILWDTKTGRRRNVFVPLRTVIALGALPHRDGPVFLTGRGRPYADRGRREGGQINYGWKQALAKTGLDPALTPHDLRHCWATWHYAVHKDLLLLKSEGEWASTRMVERYAHLLPAGQQEAIRAFRHDTVTGSEDATGTH